jgi:hypothetical protein
VTERRSDPPSPGDPRSEGPRPAPTWRDAAWALLAGVVAGATVLQLGRLAHRAATDPDVVPSTGMLLLAFVVTVVWLMTVYWVAAGSWRRTVWGCPFEHLQASPAGRRCPRHRLLGGVETTPPADVDGADVPSTSRPEEDGGH